MNINKDYLAIASVVLGIINLCAWFVPLCGIPLSVIGLGLGIAATSSNQRTLAIIGVVLCVLGLTLSCSNSVLGAYLGFTGQLGQ